MLTTACSSAVSVHGSLGPLLAKRVVMAVALVAILGTVLAGCGAEPGVTSGSSPRVQSHRCPASDVALPPFTRKVGTLVAGRAVLVCSPFSGAGVVKPEHLRFTPGWIQVAAVDGIRLPAKINMEPELPRKLQRLASCSEDEGKRFDVQVDGRWYAGRGFTCLRNL